jgi:Fe-S cluster biogenesis protein NfuA
MTEKLGTALNRENVEAVLDKVRPGLMADGGNIELVDVKDGVVTVRLTGACAGCPMSTMTLRAGVERVLRQELPELKKLEAV